MINSFRGKHSFLSNFYYSPITYEGIFYPTAEHMFQAMKTNDNTIRKYIANLTTPSQAKTFGHKILLREDWEKFKVNAMKIVLKNKFHVYELREMLLETKDEKLVEGNTWNDIFWGIDIKTGKGENNLGKLLMEVRSECRSSE